MKRANTYAEETNHPNIKTHTQINQHPPNQRTHTYPEEKKKAKHTYPNIANKGPLKEHTPTRARGESNAIAKCKNTHTQLPNNTTT